VIIVVILGAK